LAGRYFAIATSDCLHSHLLSARKMALNLSVADLWSDVMAVREHSPWVYSITNQSDMPVDEARKHLPPDVFIG
jgi:hypothetical protein